MRFRLRRNTTRKVRIMARCIKKHVDKMPEDLPELFGMYRDNDHIYTPIERLAVSRMFAAAFRITKTKGTP